MKERLLPENLSLFRERFGSFHDAVIHRVKFDLFSQTEPTTVEITIGTIDLKDDEKWVNVTFMVESVTKFNLKQERNYFLPIIFHLSIAFFEDEVYLDFDAMDDHETAADFEEEHPPKPTNFLIIGEKCNWSTSPYHERTS